MAGDTIKLTADASQAIATIEKVKGSLESMNSVIGGLHTKLAGLLLGATITNAIAFADSISDLSKATGIAEQNLLGFSAAVKANGGDSESAEKSMQKFIQSIGDAANGSLQVQTAFSRVGVTLKDLRDLSEQDLLKKTLEGLAKMSDAGQRAAAAQDIFSKSLKGVDLKGLSGDYDEATKKQLEYVKSIKEAGKLQDTLDEAFKKFQKTILKSLEPLATFINNLKPEQIDSFIKAIIQLGAAAGSLVILGKIAEGISIAFLGGAALWAKGTALITSGIASIGAVLVGFGESIGGFIVWLARSALAFNSLEISIAGIGEALSFLIALIVPIGTLLTGIAEIAIVVAAAGVAVYGLGELIDLAFDTNIIDTFNKYLSATWGWIKDVYAATLALLGLGDKEVGPKGRSYSANDVKNMNEYVDGLKKVNETDKPKREVIDALAKRRAEIENISKAFAKQNEQTLIGIQRETSYIGVSADQVEILKAQASVMDKAKDEVDKLRLAKSLLSKAEAGLAGTYDKQINKINELAATQSDQIAQAVKNREYLTNQEKIAADLLVKDLDRINAKYDERIKVEKALKDITEGITLKKTEVQFETTQIGQGPLARQMAQIQEDARKNAQAAAKTFIDSFDNYDGSIEQYNRLRAGLDEIAQGWKDISDAQIENLKNSRSWSAGWDEAFATYKENAFNAADQARTYFSDFTKGFEDMFVSLVTTGKWSFTDFANSIIADFARIQAKKLLVSMMSGGSGNIFSSIASVFGFAAGGQTDGKSPIMVGERGPEMFLPGSAGTIIPNNQLGQRYQPSITNVNYNIQAVDASSFRSLVARDPQFIYAVTEQGRRSQPSQRLA